MMRNLAAAIRDLSGKEEGEDQRDRRNMGSPFVPLDSWVYPALERLAALGLRQYRRSWA